jgi:sugar phosphate isomerase/epimerase
MFLAPKFKKITIKGLMYQPLPKSYKGAFPFKIGTTSFIYPDGYIPNVETLGPYLEEIELLLFESTPENHLPTKAEISKLGLLAEKYQLTYNIHLPIDLYLGDENMTRRNQAVESIIRISELVSPLSPSTCTLHLIYHWNTYNSTQLKIWQQTIYHSLSRLMDAGMNAEDLTIENLNYPFEWLGTIFSDFNFRVCLDFGHIFRYAQDADIILDNYGERITLIHLNGFEEDRDHISLDRLSPRQLGQIMKALKAFPGTVSMEVFSFDDLKSSLNLLEGCWQDSP